MAVVRTLEIRWEHHETNMLSLVLAATLFQHFVIPEPWPNVPTYKPHSDVAALNKSYAGKNVWLYGLQDIYCRSPYWAHDQDVGVRSSQPVKILVLQRVRGETIVLGSSFDAGFHYNAVDPLVVILDTKKLLAQQKCAVAYIYAADGWDLERLISLKPPTRVFGKPHLGMTHEDVAFAMGFPPGNKTKAELLRASRWDYPAPAAGLTSPIVLIFRGDRLVKHTGNW